VKEDDMKTNTFKTNTLFAVVITALSELYGQGTFQNLGFENPLLPLIPDGSFQVPATNALPGWRAYLGNFEVDRVVYNTVSLGAAAVSLQSSSSTVPPIVGNYSVLLQSSVGVEPTTAAVGQVGQIPATAMSLRFYGATAMQVTFAGQILSLIELGTGPNYQVVGADISTFAGQAGELKFLMPRLGPIGNMSASYLDNIAFSNQPVPEPSAVPVFGLGLLLLFGAGRIPKFQGHHRG
jgi:hypothetical protein